MIGVDATDRVVQVVMIEHHDFDSAMTSVSNAWTSDGKRLT
jgi:hypothetical protein